METVKLSQEYVETNVFRMADTPSLYHDRSNGDYLRETMGVDQWGNREFEVMYKAYPQGTPPPLTSYLTMSAETKQATTKVTKEAIDKLFYSIVYGTEMPKEKEMEIGGNLCHLCGASMLYNGISRTFVKNHREVEQNTAYDCGTQVYSTWREKDDLLSGYKKARHIHVGNDCIEVD